MLAVVSAHSSATRSLDHLLCRSRTGWPRRGERAATVLLLKSPWVPTDRESFSLPRAVQRAGALVPALSTSLGSEGRVAGTTRSFQGSFGG